MKVIKYSLLVLLSCFNIGIAFANNAMPEVLVGRWQFDGGRNGAFPEVMTFNNDGSYKVEGLLAQGNSKINEACIVTITGMANVSAQSKDQFNFETTSANLTLNYPAPGTSEATCQNMVKSMNAGSIFSLSDTFVLIDNGFALQAHDLSGSEAKFRRF